MAEPSGLEDAPAPFPFVVEEPALARSVAGWQRWLVDERRSSPNTVAPYSRALAAFLVFITIHPCTLPTLPDIPPPPTVAFLTLPPHSPGPHIPKTTPAPPPSL